MKRISIGKGLLWQIEHPHYTDVPSLTIEELKKCLTDFNYWSKHYVKFIEYNNNTSAGHPVKDDDIVRYSLETRRVNDKER